MNQRSARRAAVRKQRKTSEQTASCPAIEISHGAVALALVPNEQELPPYGASGFEALITAGESRDEFLEHSEALADFYLPFNPEERAFVEKLAQYRWAARRSRRAFNCVESSLYAAHPDPSQWSTADFKRLTLAAAYRAQAEQASGRAQKSVDVFMRQRIQDYRWEARYELAVRRFEWQKKKYELAAQKAEARETRAAAGAVSAALSESLVRE
jgi:hypothetical protein